MHSAEILQAPGVPPFTAAEYRDRQQQVRRHMEAGGIDLLYITSPANLFYLTGYQAIWYPNRLPLGAVINSAGLVFFDWTRHVPYTTTQVVCDDTVFFDYGNAAEVVAAAFALRGWQGCNVGIEWFSLNPSAPVMTAVAAGLRSLGCTLVAADWIVDRVRLYKSAAELERIRRAGAIADAAMLQLQADLRPGMSEIEVSAHLGQLLAARGSEIAATPVLVNSGPTAWADVHAFPSHRRLQPGDTVSVDCCAVIDRYHANLARTFALGEPNRLAQQVLAAGGGSLAELQKTARLGAGPEQALAAASRYIHERVAAENIWWIGGYALGIALPPSWVGHTYLANDGPEKCSWLPGYVSNYENVFIDREQGFEAQTIDTIVMTETGVEVLSTLPRRLLEVAV